MAKLHIKKNDTVIVLAGEDKGKTGKVLQILKEKERAIVDLSLIDPKSGKATRVSIKHEGKNVVRIAKKSGEVIK